MIPANTPLELYRNDSWIASGAIYDEQDPPQIIDIQNATILAQIRRRPGGSVVYSITNGYGITINTDNTWEIDCIVTVSRAGKYYWDFQVTQNLTGTVNTYYGGICTIYDDISRLT